MKIAALFFYPFEKGLISPITEEVSCAAVECAHDTAFDQINNLDVFAAFKPMVDAWQKGGYLVLPELEGNYDVIFLHVPKQKINAQQQIAACLHQLHDGGKLICVAANDAGGKSLEKMIKNFGGETQSLSKSKCRITVLHKKDLNEVVIKEALQDGEPKEKFFDGASYVTQAGIFGWNKIDRGSKFLIENIPADLKGFGADFGCGYGYLSYNILQKNPAIKNFYAIDADYRALECTKENLREFDVVYLWEDLTQFSLPSVDWILMNPPFHKGKKTDSDIGKKFIENAAKSLKKAGVLYMVANAHLPYENTLDTYFSHKEKVQERDGFKIFKAIK